MMQDFGHINRIQVWRNNSTEENRRPTRSENRREDIDFED